MNKNEAALFQKFQLYRPYIRSILAFIHFIRFGSITANSVGANYSTIDTFIRQLEKDLTER